MIGRNSKTSKFDGVEDQILHGFHRLRPLVGIKITQVVSGPVSCTCLAISESGQLFSWGRNDNGELGLGHQTNVYNPMPVQVPGDTIVKGAACGSNHTLVYSNSGDLFSCGVGKNGQLGIGKKPDFVTKLVKVETSPKVVNAACGREFSMVVGDDGSIYSFGFPEKGVLGNGTEGKTLERANKFTYECITTPWAITGIRAKYGDNVKITNVACGAQHTCAMDDQGRIYTWGFGAYGRLGHGDNKDQMEPLAVELFSFEPPPPDPNVPKFMQRQQPQIRGAQIACGNTSTFVVSGEPYHALYRFGITKKSGEAQMKPMLEDQVHGWRVRSVSCGNTSICIASERTLITWGPSPTFGELGYGEGEPRSSTVSKKVDSLEGALTMQVASGLAFTLAVIDTSDETSQKILEKLPVFEPKEVDSKVAKQLAVQAVEESRAKRARKKEMSKATAADDEEEDAEDEIQNDDDDHDHDDEEYQGEKPKRKKRKQ